MNKNRKIKCKITAGIAAGMSLVLGTLPVCAADPSISKDETVYVNADPSGNQKQVTVSNWLKNAGLTDTVADESTLDGIKNIKGTETFSEAGDSLTWDTDGKDIYYQGTTEKKLPVSVKLTYFLDGTEISPQDLKGKSGHLQIKIDYTNHEKKTVTIDGTSEEVYSPFVMLTGLILPTDTFSNVMIDNGKVISDGNRNIVLGFTTPGLKESLGMSDAASDSSLTLPESLEISADVTDFTMSSTFTVGLSDLFDQLNLQDITDMDSLKASLDELENAAMQLVDGSARLSEGADTLGDSYEEFDAGIQTLKTGIDALNQGADTLSNGIRAYTTGADQLNAGIQTYLGSNGILTGKVTEYVNGVNTLVLGTKSYTEGADQLCDGISSYIEGEQQLSDGASQLSELGDGLIQIKSAITQLNSALDGKGSSSEDIKAASSQLAKATEQLSDALDKMQPLLEQVDSMTSSGQKLLEEVSSLSSDLKQEMMQPALQLITGMKQLTLQLQEINQTVSTFKTSCDAIVSNINTQINEQNAQIQTMSNTAANTSSQIQASIDSLNEQLTQATASGNTELAAQLQSSINILTEAQAQAGNLSTSLHPLTPVTNDGNSQLPSLDTTAFTQTIAQISTAYQSVQSSFVKLAAKLPDIQKQLDQLSSIQLPEKPMDQLKDSVNKINKGMKALDQGLSKVSQNIETLDTSTDSLPTAVKGIDTLLSGFQQLDGYNQTLLNGAASLKANSPSLVTGVNTLAGGTDELAAGLNTLGSQLSGGSAELAANSEILRTGASSLLAGTTELSNGGTTLFNGSKQVKDGISQLQNGAHTLNDGMQKFDQEGTRKLKNTVEQELGSILDRLEALTSDSCSYDTFSGKSKGMEGTVKFVIETDAIE